MAVFGLTTFIRRTFGLSDATLYANGGTAYSGALVNASSALTISTVFRCVMLIASSIAALPCGLFSLDAEGDEVALVNDPVYKILRRRPNADMSAFHFWQAVVACILLWGNAYGHKKFQNGRLVSIELLLPELITIEELTNGAYQFVYAYGGSRRVIPETDMVHWKGLSLSGRIGLSVLAFARQSIGNALSMQETAGQLYANGLRPGGALKLPGFLKGTQRDEIRAGIAAEISGVAKTGGTIILEGGMEYESLTIPPEDAQFIQSMNASTEDICRWFGVNPVLIGASSTVTAWGTGIEQIRLAFLGFTLNPILVSIEQENDRSIVPIAKRDIQFSKFDTKSFLAADSTGRAALYNSASQNGWMTRAEIRKRENLPFIPGSDTLTVQTALTNLQNLDQIDAAKTPAKIEDTGKV